MALRKSLRLATACVFRAGLIAAVSVVAWSGVGLAQETPVYLNTAQPVEARVKDLVGRMTLEEKVSQMQNHAVAIPRLNVPEYDWWSDWAGGYVGHAADAYRRNDDLDGGSGEELRGVAEQHSQHLLRTGYMVAEH
jgi:hypothetical protein